jgi:hypothetical protein
VNDRKLLASSRRGSDPQGARFRLGGGRAGGWAGGGWLQVAPNTLSYERDGLVSKLSAEKRIIHRGTTVWTVRARLLPPLLNTGLLLEDDAGIVRLLPWYGNYRRIVNALREAGFTVRERRTWFALGLHVASGAESAGC